MKNTLKRIRFFYYKLPLIPNLALFSLLGVGGVSAKHLTTYLDDYDYEHNYLYDCESNYIYEPNYIYERGLQLLTTLIWIRSGPDNTDMTTTPDNTDYNS